jgi:hypothetical protein
MCLSDVRIRIPKKRSLLKTATNPEAFGDGSIALAGEPGDWSVTKLS